MRQIEVYEELATISPNLRVIRYRHDLDIVLRSWRGKPDQRQVGVVYLMEGGDAIQEPEEIGLWYARGLRFVVPGGHALLRHFGAGAVD
jgi:hypothetical protein